MKLIQGYYVFQGRGCTNVHLVNAETGKPVCGYKPARGYEFQYCNHGIDFVYLECSQCIVRADKLHQQASFVIENMMAKAAMRACKPSKEELRKKVEQALVETALVHTRAEDVGVPWKDINILRRARRKLCALYKEVS